MIHARYPSSVYCTIYILGGDRESQTSGFDSNLELRGKFRASNISDPNYDGLLPPTRDTRHRHRSPARPTNRAESVLPRLQIMGSALPNPPFRLRRVQCVRAFYQTMDGGLSGSSKFSLSLHSDPHGYWPSVRCWYGQRCDSLDPLLPQCRALHLDVETRGRTSFERASLSLFPGLSPAIKSLRLKSLHTPPCTLFDLIYSFSLLEDLTLLALAPVPEPDHWTTPSTFPRFTGSLLLSGGIGPITRRLLDLPNGLHFTKIALTFDYEADFKLATDLVSRCSHTLESLNVTRDPGVFPSPPCMVDALPL